MAKKRYIAGDLIKFTKPFWAVIPGSAGTSSFRITSGMIGYVLGPPVRYPYEDDELDGGPVDVDKMIEAPWGSVPIHVGGLTLHIIDPERLSDRISRRAP